MSGPPREESEKPAARSAINVADIVEKNDKTIRHNNMEIQHAIPIGALVEIRCEEAAEWHGCRLYVIGHGRDCDGTPLYSLGRKGETNRFMMICNGWPENTLFLVGPAADGDTTFGNLEVGDLFIDYAYEDGGAAVLMRKLDQGPDPKAQNAETYRHEGFGHLRDDARVIKVSKDL